MRSQIIKIKKLSFNFLSLLILFFLFGCYSAGDFMYDGKFVAVRYSDSVPMIYLSKEQTRDIATDKCNIRFKSKSVKLVKSTFGYGEDWHVYECNAPKAEINPKNSDETDTNIIEAKEKCSARGIEKETEEFGECVLKLSK